MTMPLLEALKTLRNMAVSGNADKNSWGICKYMEEMVFAYYSSMVRCHYHDWAHFSGCHIFPIQGGRDTFCDSNTEKWQGDQLNYRLSLINHMINKIEGIV